jgi:short-subunit dehydrogenase
MQLRSRWVLITGASSGLGKEMAVQLATQHGSNLILVARRLEQLQALQKQLVHDAGVQVEVIQADLSVAEDVDRVFEVSTQMADVYAVILNAGVTFYGRQRDLAWPRFQAMLSTNLTSVVRLADLFLPYLVQQKQAGGLMFVTSMAGLLPVPYQTAYAATKAFVTQFGQGLYQEYRHEPVSITVYAPGGIHTEMNQSSGLADHFGDSIFIQSAQACAQTGIRAMIKRRYLVVPGVLNNVQVALARFLPRKLLGRIAAQAYVGGLKNKSS